ncbi:MAG: AsmA family protein [Phycisphaeraceae bacterium]|nr:AsmA family protein [Phycisphaeraceae bacterium]
MKNLKKILALLTLLVVISAVGIGAILFFALRSGSGQLETWLGKQLVGIASAYIEPTVDFRKINYSYPGTVVLADVTFTAKDKTEVVRLDKLTITLAAIPKIGEPLKIERVEFEKPTIALIAVPGGGFKGLVPFVKNIPGKESAQTPAEFKLSNVLQLRKFILRNGTVRYDAGGGQPIMILDGITTDMDIKPITVGSETGWYELAFDAGKAPGVEIKVKGQVNLDTSVANIADASMNVILDEKSMQGLPPQLQSTLKAAEARGKLGAQISGRVPANEWRTSELKGAVTLTDFNVAAGRFKFPIDSGTVPISLQGGVANLSPIQINLLSGQFASTISANLSDTSIPVQGNWQATNLDLEKLMRAQQDVNAPPGFQGQLNSAGNFGLSAGAASPPAILATATGAGDLNVRNGRLFVVPGLMDAMNLATGKAVPLVDEATKHSLDANFNITGQGIQVTQSHIVASALDARATGLIDWNLNLNMSATANPIAAVTQPLGAIGRMIGNVTKEMIQYQITGTVGDPKVLVKPFGLGGN